MSFFTWAHEAGHIPTNPAEHLPVMRAGAPAPRPAPDAVWNAALTEAEPRTRLMLRLAAEVGLRQSEIARVHARDLTRGPAGAQLLVHGKGSKRRVVPINDDLAGTIAASRGFLFPGDEEGHLSPRWVGKLIAGALPDHWTAHTLRHRFATRAYRGSRNLRAVQSLLGHSSVATTERYTAVDADEIRAAMLSAQ